MLNFKSYLLENRVDFIKGQNPTIDTSHDTLAKHRDAGDIIDHFATHADPSGNKQHTQWIVNRYKDQDFRQEDAPRIHKALSDFTKHKARLEKRDLNQYKHLSDVEDAVEPHLGIKSNKEQKRAVKQDGADLVHSGPKFTVHHLKTKEAACAYGAGTKWCTAAENDNMFDDYHKEGAIHIITNKSTGEKHQLHFATNQFMDEKDRPADLEHFVRDNPELKHADPIKQWRSIKNNDANSHEIGNVLQHHDAHLRLLAAGHPKASKDHISTALADTELSVRERAAQHPNANKDHISTALNDKDWSVRAIAARHPNATRDHISKALGDHIDDVRYAASVHPNIDNEQLHRASNDQDPTIRDVARYRLAGGSNQRSSIVGWASKIFGGRK